MDRQKVYEIKNENTQKLKEIILERERLDQTNLFLDGIRKNELDKKYYNDLVYERLKKEKLNERKKAEIYRNETMKDLRCSNDLFLMNTFEQNLDNKMTEQVGNKIINYHHSYYN